jgi:glycosyltransferase involved in cell wall biosynthesis
MKPDISIIVPAYNVERYIGEAIRSALAQTSVKAEVIVVEDGSSDRTAEAIARVGSDPRLLVIRQANRGPSGARNTGLAAANGRYAGFLDGDDLWEPSKAARHVALMDTRPELDLTYSWWRTIDAAGRDTGRVNRTRVEDLPRGATFSGLLVENFTGTASTVVCRRSALEAARGFDVELRSNVDLDLWLRVGAQRDGNIGLIEEVLTEYRVHGEQITGNWRRMMTGWEKVLEKARAIAPAQVAAVEPLARARLARYLAYLAYEQKDYPVARQMILEAWLGAPWLMARDRGGWLVSAGIGAATLLPGAFHDRLSAGARRLRSEGAAPAPRDHAAAAGGAR